MLTPSSWAPVHDSPHPLIVRVVRWSPILMPAVIGSLLLTLMLLVVERSGYPVYAPLLPSATVPALFVTYLVGGALLGLALFFSPNGVVWSLAFFGIPPLLLTVMLSIALGVPGAALALSSLAALLLLLSVARRKLTRPGTVEVTLLFGEWYRTLPPGFNILLPGERVIVALRTPPRALTTTLQRVTIGPNRIAQARATVSYVIDPREAWRTASVRATWEEELRQRISDSVRESLGVWRASGGVMAGQVSIAQRALDDTRDWARSVGVRLLSVRAHDIVNGSPEELARPPRVSAPSRPTPRVNSSGSTSSAEPDVRVERAQVTSRPVAQAALERPSTEALEDLYEAVRKRQITDTQVIREIASHFAALAHEPGATEDELPFDPAAAARYLTNYADAVDARPTQRTRRR